MVTNTAKSREMKVAIDVDGVLRDFVGSLHKCLIMDGLILENTPMPEITSWGLHQFYPQIESTEEFYDYIFRSESTFNLFSSAPIYKGAKEFMELLEKGHEVGIITSQNEAGWRATLVWLFANQITPPNIHCIRFDLMKADKTIWDYEVILDDKPSHVHEFLDKDRMGFLLDRPWNQEVDLPRVFSYGEFIEELNGME